MTPPSSRGHGDHRVVLDVQLLLVADAVRPLEDEVGRGEARLEVARCDLVVGEDVVRTRADRRPAASGSVRTCTASRAAARSVARSGAARRASGSAWWRISPPIGTRIGWSSLIERDDVVAGDVGRGDDDHRRPVEVVGRGSSADEAGVRARSSGSSRRTRRPERRGRRRTSPRRSAWLGPRDGAARPLRARPGAMVPGARTRAVGAPVRVVRSGNRPPLWRLTIPPGGSRFSRRAPPDTSDTSRSRSARRDRSARFAARNSPNRGGTPRPASAVGEPVVGQVVASRRGAGRGR